MAYNNMFPVGYQPYYAQQPVQQQSNSIIWVQGEAGAKSYMVAPNTTVQLWDSEEQVIYLKSADASGMPSMKVLDYKVRNSVPSPEVTNALLKDEKYVTKEELKAFQESVEKRLKSLADGGLNNE